MQGASALASESATPGRNRPSSAGAPDFFGSRMNGSRRHSGRKGKDGPCRLDAIQWASVRFSLARSRGLPAKGIIQALRKKASRNEATQAFGQISPIRRQMHVGSVRSISPAIRVVVMETVADA